MKLTALYTVWNGLELLEKSIDQIIDHVDYVVIAWQYKSNKGENNELIKPFLKRFNDSRIHLIEFTPNFNVNTKQNEREKHNLLIKYAKKLKSTHYFFSATDHFYRPQDFISAKNYCKKHDFDVTFTSMFTYYRHATWQLSPIESYFMPFICKLYPHTEIVRAKNYPVLVDPSIQVNTCEKHYVFNPHEIMMHHYSMIRVDIDNKFRNAAASIRWNDQQIKQFKQEYDSAKLGDSISYFQGKVLVEAPDYFKIE